MANTGDFGYLPDMTDTKDSTAPASTELAVSTLLDQLGAWIDRVMRPRSAPIRISYYGRHVATLRGPRPADQGVRIVNSQDLYPSWRTMRRLLEASNGRVGVGRWNFDQAEVVLELVQDQAAEAAPAAPSA